MMKMVVIKFEEGYRLVRTHRAVELWWMGTKLEVFGTWEEAIASIDQLEGKEIPVVWPQESAKDIFTN